jgi:hypothetical protein
VNPGRKTIQIDDATYELLRGSPEAIALRTRSIEWKEASDKDDLNHTPGCKHERAAERAHRAFFDAALQFAEAVRRRGSTYLHLWASKGDFVEFYPMTREAKQWARAHAFDKKYVFMESFVGEELTVRSPLDKRVRRTFGPQEATWGHVDSESEKVRYERALGLLRDPWAPKQKRRHP